MTKTDVYEICRDWDDVVLWRGLGPDVPHDFYLLYSGVTLAFYINDEKVGRPAEGAAK